MVLPNPGTPSSRAWPSASRQTTTARTKASWPTITLPTSRSMAMAVSAYCSGVTLVTEHPFLACLGSFSPLIQSFDRSKKLLIRSRTFCDSSGWSRATEPAL